MSLAIQKIDTSAPIRSVQTARSLFESPGFANELMKLLGRSIPKEHFLRVALNALQRKPELLECDGRSLCGALMDCAQMGLEPRGAYGMHLVSFKNNRTGRRECQAIIDFRALRNKVIEAGSAKSIAVAVVYEGDEFYHELGDSPSLKHIPRFATSADADLLYAYAIAWLPDGNRAYAVLTRDMIDKTKARSKARDSGPWVSDYAEMAKKTAVKRVCKMLFIPPALQDAIERDDSRESIDMGGVVDLTPMAEVEEDAGPVAVPITAPDSPKRRGPRPVPVRQPEIVPQPERDPGMEDEDQAAFEQAAKGEVQ